MRTCLDICRISPEQKMKDVNFLIDMIARQPVFTEWSMTIDTNPINLSNQTILPDPQIIKENQVIHIN